MQTFLIAWAFVVACGLVWWALQSLARSVSEASRQARQRRADEQAQQRARREAEAAGATRRRCENARLQAELHYTLHAAELGERLPRDLFTDLFQRWLPPEITDPDHLELRSAQLQDLVHRQLALPEEKREREEALKRRQQEEQEVKERAEKERREREQREQAERLRGGQAIKDLTDWYQAQRAAIDTSIQDSDTRDDLLLELDKRYDELLKQLLRNMQP